MLYNTLTASFLLASVTSTFAAPTGGQGLSGTAEYVPMSDFDFQSLNLALQQEWLELYLFRAGLEKFSAQNFSDAGFSQADQELLSYMADQEVGHAQLLTNILGSNASKPCNYSFNFNTIPQFIALSERVTRVGESGVFGFLPHLDSRPASELLGQAVATESRQQMVFRQFQGLFPMPFWFIPGITQSMAWTLQAPFLASCPSENPTVEWQIFPALNVTTIINSNGSTPQPAISTSSSPLSTPGQSLNLTWEDAGLAAGPNSTYNTSSTAGEAKFAAWISQLNVTYTPLTNLSGNSALTTQPGGNVYQDILGNDTTPVINGTIFLLVTDDQPYVTPFNLSQIESHIVAGPVLYTVG